MSKATTTKPTLIPPDLARCQAEHREGSFMTLGPRSMVRCTAPPTTIITEARKDKYDGLKGSMSVCDACLAIARKRFPAGHFKMRAINPGPPGDEAA